MPNLNSFIGGLANVANQLQGSRQGKGGNSSNPTPNQGGSGYPNQGNSGYPSQGNSAYPNQGNSAYPNQGNNGYPNQGNSGYPNQGNSGYPSQGNSGYPNQGNNGYPNQSGSNYTGYGGNTGGPQAYQGYGGVYGNGQRFDGAPSPPTQGGYPPLMPTQGDYRPLMPSQGGYQPYPNQQSYQSYGNTPQPGYPSQPSFGGNYYSNSSPPIGFNIGFSSAGNNSPYPASNSVPYPTTDVGPGGFAPSPPIGYGAQPNAYGSPPSQGYGPPQNQYPYPNLGQSAQQQPSAPPQYQSAYAPQMWNNPSIRPASGFNGNADAESLRKAMKGLGCNNSKVVAVLCGRSNWQRQEIAKAFKVMYGKDLIKELKGELSGDFEDLIMALMEPPARYDAEQLHKAMAGLGTKESVLIEIMTTRTNAQIQELKMTYKQMYGHDLERDLIGETSGHFKRLLVSLCAGGRDESNYTDPLKANQDARNLYRAGEQRLGTDESCFNAILASQNMYQLRMVFDEYQKVTKHSIEKAIESEFSSDIRDGLLAVIKSIRYRPAYFAELLNNSMKGFGTRDNDLIRLVVTRAEIDLRDIQQSYHQLYKTSLENAIAGDCSGAYKEGLIALVKGNY